MENMNKKGQSTTQGITVLLVHHAKDTYQTARAYFALSWTNSSNLELWQCHSWKNFLKQILLTDSYMSMCHSNVCQYSLEELEPIGLSFDSQFLSLFLDIGYRLVLYFQLILILFISTWSIGSVSFLTEILVLLVFRWPIGLFYTSKSGYVI